MPQLPKYSKPFPSQKTAAHHVNKGSVLLFVLIEPYSQGWFILSDALLEEPMQYISCGVSSSGPVEHVQLLTPFVVIRNKEVNITAVALPSHPRTVTYFWWLGNNTEVIYTAKNSWIDIVMLILLLDMFVQMIIHEKVSSYKKIAQEGEGKDAIIVFIRKCATHLWFFKWL